MESKVMATFTKSNGFIYRTETYIQFGECDKIIGSCVLCNPGSSRLKDPEKQSELEEHDGEDKLIIKNEAKKDATIRQLIKIIEETKGLKKEGKFLIYNTFTLRNSNMDNALREIQDPAMDKTLLYKDFEDYKKNRDSVKWMLIGWGCKSNARLNKIKKEWLGDINESDFPSIGNENINKPHYYHPKPATVANQITYRDIIIPKIEKILEKN